MYAGIIGAFYILALGVALSEDEKFGKAICQVLVLMPIFGRVFGWW